MSFFKVPEWMVEFPEEKALALSKNSHLPDGSLSRLAQSYREICSDWSNYSYQEGEDISDVTAANGIEAHYRVFLEIYLQCRQMGHGEEFSFTYASESYYACKFNECEIQAEAKTEAYRAVAALAASEALIGCKALGRSPAFTRKYVESIANREREEDAVKWAERYEQGVRECVGLKYSEAYIHQYADQRACDISPE
jgi:hypothetical protein